MNILAAGGALAPSPMITNDAVVLGILLGILAIIFTTSHSENKRCKKFYKYVPALLLCYFIPSIFGSFNIISGHSSHSKLYFIASRYLLPTSLVLLTLSIDLKSILGLGYKAIVMFLAGTIGIVIGGPIAIMVVMQIDPAIVAGEGANAVWRGMATLAGSWIGGGANQAAMEGMFNPSAELYSAMITVDVIVANVWMAFLLYGAGVYKSIDKKLKADNTAIEELKQKIASYKAQNERIATTTDLMVILAVGFGVTAISHFFADIISPSLSELAKNDSYKFLKDFSLTSHFFWLIIIATTIGMILSFTKARKLENVGASNVGSVFLYILVATIGVKMNIFAITENPGLFLLGSVWMLVHAFVLITTAIIIKAPFFFVAVGSQANVGGAASAPIVASAFHPALAPVGVLLAVLGYGLGTYAAWICAQLMRVMTN